MGKVATGRQDANGGGPVDWAALKKSIVGKLMIKVEYEKLGVRFTRPGPDSKGWIPCHAVGRPVDNPDEVPSAAVNVDSGVYHDSGDGGQSLGFFDFAMKHGDFGRWIDCIKHYATEAGVEVGKFPTLSGGRIREAVYEYREADGAVKYAVFRYRLPSGKKTFTQHPPDGKSGWRTGAGCMDGVEPLPYRLPELLQSAPTNQAVIIVEGEKDAERLAALGLIATTSHGGTGNTDKAWPIIAPHFAGRDCRIIPDNDRAGKDHASKVATYLHPHAKSLRIVPLPGLPERGDVSDWLDQGHTLAELQTLADAAPEFDPAAPETEPGAEAEGEDEEIAHVGHLRHFLSNVSWLWPGWIPSGALTLIAAEAGTGKTRFCFDLHRRVYHQLPWPDGTEMTIPPGKALWVVADHQYREMVDIPTDFGIPDEFVLMNTCPSDPFGGTSLQTEEELREFEARIKKAKPTFVFIDTITNTADFKTQDASDAKRQYKPLQEIATRLQVAIICVTHLNASGQVLGRRAKEKVRVLIQMELPDPEQPLRRRLWVAKSRDLLPPPLGITMGSEGNEYDDQPPAPRDSAPIPERLREAMDWLEKYLASGESQVKPLRRQAEQDGFDSKLLYRARDELGVIETKRDDKTYWALGDGSDPEDYDESPY